MKRVLLLGILLLILMGSCRRTCRCYRYDGNVDEFEQEDFEEYGYSTCSGMEYVNYGLTYLICEWVL